MMTNYNSENSTFYNDLLEKSFCFFNTKSEYQNEISSIGGSTNLLSNNVSSIDECSIFREEKENDLQLFLISHKEIEPQKSFEEEKEEESKLYFVKNEDLSQEQEKDKSVKLSLEKENVSKGSNQFLTRKKRGRPKANEQNKKEKIVHDKFSHDNLLRKIQVHYISFIVSFMNEILKILNYPQQFLKLSYSFKKNVNKRFVDSLKSKNLREILCNEISVKYRNKDKNSNILICEEIEKNEILSRILSDNYLKIFKNVYFQSNRIINLKDYGLDKEIILSQNVKMYKDLLKDNEAFENYKEYQKNMDDCANQNFF